MLNASDRQRRTRAVWSAMIALAMAGLPGAAQATSYSWQSPADGDFNNPASWGKTTTYPTNEDYAYFSVAGGPYTVSFTGSQQTERAYVNAGDVEWDLGGGTYTVSDIFLAGSSAVSSALSVFNGTLDINNTYVGYAAGSNNTVTFGAESTSSVWQTPGNMRIGYSGTGTFNAGHGATGTTSSPIYLGYSASGDGTFNLTGDGTTWNTGTGANGIYVGNNGTGTMTVSDGATVTTTNVYLGRGAGSEDNSLQITGGGTMTGTLLMIAYAPADNTDPENIIPASSGDVLISGDGSSWTGTEVTYVGGAAVAGGTGSLTIEQGGRLSATKLVVWKQTGTLKLDGSTINVGTSSVTSYGAHLEVSDLSNAINGNLVLTAYTGDTPDTTVHLGGDDDYGHVSVSNKITFAGILNVVLDGSYMPSSGDVFDLFNWTDSSGTFSAVHLPTLGNGLSWSWEDSLYSEGTIHVVPEPASFGLLVLGGFMALRRRRGG